MCYLSNISNKNYHYLKAAASQTESAAFNLPIKVLEIISVVVNHLLVKSISNYFNYSCVCYCCIYANKMLEYTTDGTIIRFY